MLAYLAAASAPHWLGDGSPAITARIQQCLSLSHWLTSSLSQADDGKLPVILRDVNVLTVGPSIKAIGGYAGE